MDFGGGSRNQVFGHHVGKNEKKGVQERLRKKHEIYILEAKRGGSERQNVVISLDLLQNMRFRRSRNFMKNGGRNGIQNGENRSFGRPWAGILFFWEVFGGARFLMFFGTAKSRPKIRKIRHFGARKASGR